MPPARFERATFGLGIVLYNVYPVFYVMPRIEFVDYVHGVKTSLVSIVGVKHSGSNLHGKGVQKNTLEMI